MSDQVDIITKTDKSRREGPRRRRWLRRFLWALLLIAVALIVLAAVFWLNRYSLFERQARNEFSKVGIESKFDIKEITRTEAVFENMRFSDADGQFFSADQLIVKYRIEKLRAGIVDQVILKKPILRLTLDSNGNVIDRWVPETNEESEPVSVPIDGIEIEDGVVNWAAPWGAGVTGINAQIQSETEWQSQIFMQSARMAQDDIEIDFGFIGNIDRHSERELDVKGQTSWQSARIREALFGPMTADVDLQLTGFEDSEKIELISDLDVTLNGIVFPVFAAGHTKLDTQISAEFDLEQNSFDLIRTDWVMDGSDFSLTDAGLRTQLVDRTIAYNALSKTPIATHFVGEIRRNGNRFLEQFAANGAGQFIQNRSGYEVKLNAPLNLTSNGQSAVIEPVAGPDVVFDAFAQTVDMNMHVDWRSSRGLDLENLRVQGRSENGFVLSGVEHVSAQVKSKNTWSRSFKGDDIRLAPIDIKLKLDNSSRGSRVAINGAIKYD
ncbi:MAG: hypothetical protein EX271_03490, partial [Acidimicrobiales bacterium]